MRYLIVSDIHGNLAALTSVLEDAEGRYDSIINCGDVVGYGPDPNAVLDWCRLTPQMLVRGNHDKACAGLSDLEWFNPVARSAALWTAANLTDDNLDYLIALQQGPVLTDAFEVFHGAPGDEDEYLLDRYAVDYAKADLARGLAFFGHTHVQGGFVLHRTGTHPVFPGEYIKIDERAGYLINPGSVGQPRDHDPRAAYAIYDEGARRVEYGRVEYDITTTCQRITKAGLPEVLGRRLLQGV